MSSRSLPFGRALLAIAALTCTATTAPAPQTRSNSAPAVAAGQTYFPEVRLRKLHLVRPDLIPYPLTFDVYC